MLSSCFALHVKEGAQALASRSPKASRAVLKSFTAIILKYTLTFLLLAGLLAFSVRLCFMILITASCSAIFSTPVVLFADIHIPHTVIVFDKVTCIKTA